MIEYIIGDATNPKSDKKILIPHIVNTYGGWGAGFVLALSKKWSLPERAYREWHLTNCNKFKGDVSFELGNIQYIPVDKGLAVVNMVAQEGYGKLDSPAVRYKAVEKCLSKLAKVAVSNNAEVHAPRFGCGLGGGEWSNIEEIIERTLAPETRIVIYDLH